jgi:hypothetical protein
MGIAIVTESGTRTDRYSELEVTESGTQTDRYI